MQVGNDGVLRRRHAGTRRSRTRSWRRSARSRRAAPLHHQHARPSGSCGRQREHPQGRQHDCRRQRVRRYPGRGAGRADHRARQRPEAHERADRHAVADARRRRGRPSTFVGDDKKLFFNGEGIQIFHQPAAHTDGDSIVFFRQSDVISTGDIFMTDQLPVHRSGSGRQHPGHHRRPQPHHRPLHSGRTGRKAARWSSRATAGCAIWATCINYREMVTIIRDRVQDMVKKGHDARTGEGGQADARLRPTLRTTTGASGPPTCSSKPSTGRLSTGNHDERDSA